MADKRACSQLPILIYYCCCC